MLDWVTVLLTHHYAQPQIRWVRGWRIGQPQGLGIAHNGGFTQFHPSRIPRIVRNSKLGGLGVGKLHVGIGQYQGLAHFHIGGLNMVRVGGWATPGVGFCAQC